IDSVFGRVVCRRALGSSRREEAKPRAALAGCRRRELAGHKSDVGFMTDSELVMRGAVGRQEGVSEDADTSWMMTDRMTGRMTGRRDDGQRIRYYGVLR